MLLDLEKFVIALLFFGLGVGTVFYPAVGVPVLSVYGGLHVVFAVLLVVVYWDGG